MLRSSLFLCNEMHVSIIYVWELCMKLCNTFYVKAIGMCRKESSREQIKELKVAPLPMSYPQTYLLEALCASCVYSPKFVQVIRFAFCYDKRIAQKSINLIQ